MNPKVSIIMPVLNGERYIAEAIQSIVAQTYTNYELIVIDDGSKDNTYEKLDSYRPNLDLKYCRHSGRKGIPASMNAGLRNASGDLIAFLDHDDTWLPDMLQTLVEYLEAHKDVAMVHSDFQTIDSEGKVIERSVAACRGRTRPSGYIFPELFIESLIAGNAVLVRKECFERVGHYDESLYFGDYDMWLRISRCFRIDFVDKVLTTYRQHIHQSTRTLAIGQPAQESVALAVIEKTLKLHPEAREELGETVINRRLATLHFDVAYSSFAGGIFGNVRPHLGKAIRYRPNHYKYYLFYLASFLRPSHAWAAREFWHRLRPVFFLGRRDEREAC